MTFFVNIFLLLNDLRKNVPSVAVLTCSDDTTVLNFSIILYEINEKKIGKEFIVNNTINKSLKLLGIVMNNYLN